mgnify:CR=1 FL=1
MNTTTDIKNLDTYLNRICNYNEIDKRTYPQIKIKNQEIRTGKKPVVFSKDVINFLLVAHQKYYQKVHWDVGCNVTDQNRPLCFIFGQKDNVISIARPLFSHYGCGNMAQLHSDEINKISFELIRDGYFVAGFGRIGFFSIKSNHNRGASLKNLLTVTKTQGLFMLSLGHNGLMVEFPSSKNKYEKHSYQIVNKQRKEVTKNGTNKTHQSRVGRIGRTARS